MKEKIFVIIGLDFFGRQQVIERIKKRIARFKETPLNVLTFYSREIDLKNLQEKVLTFSFEQERIVIFKMAGHLPIEIKDLLLKYMDKIVLYNYVIFEIEEDSRQWEKSKKIDKFFSFLLKEGTVLRIASVVRELSLDDFKKSIRMNNVSQAVCVLEHLFKEKGKERELGPQILGILIRHYSYMKNAQKKQECFDHIWYADRAIKEKGLNARLVLEVLLVKLMCSTTNER